MKIAKITTDGTSEGTEILDEHGNELAFTCDYDEIEEDGFERRVLVITSIFDVETCEGVDEAALAEANRVAAA